MSIVGRLAGRAYKGSSKSNANWKAIQEKEI
jgi:hypothetical protein